MSELQTSTTSSESTQEATTSLFENLITGRTISEDFGTQDDGKIKRIENAVQTLAQFALKDVSLISEDTISSIQAIIANIDKKLTEQINLILHHEDFQKLEGSWRGLHYMVNNTETDTQLKIRVMNISKKELSGTLKRFKGTSWDQSPLFKKIYSAEYGTFGGNPFGCLMGDYYFDHSPQDVELLKQLAEISAASHAPFISGVSPTLFDMDSFTKLSDPRDLAKIFDTPEYAAWNSLRESDDSKYLGLALPRVLSRLPYGSKTDPVDAFDFEENTDAANSANYTWTNAAYAMATNINRAFKQYGWCTRIRGVESGGAVENLPVHTFPTDDGGVEMKCPTEIGITLLREAELTGLGLMPLSHRKNTDFAAFIGAESLHKPKVYNDPEATANAKLASRLPYLFATCRFAHYLNKMVYDKVGSFKEKDDMQKWLNQWILNYVDGDPDNSTENYKASHPLRDANVIVEEVEGNPGYYTSKFFLRPHYQLEGLTVSLSLVSKVPSGN